jgi:hypothetical protein
MLVTTLTPQQPEFSPKSNDVGFVVDNVAPGQGSSEYIDFLCHFSFHQMLYTHLSLGVGATGRLMASVPSGLILTLPH